MFNLTLDQSTAYYVSAAIFAGLLILVFILVLWGTKKTTTWFSRKSQTGYDTLFTFKYKGVVYENQPKKVWEMFRHQGDKNYLVYISEQSVAHKVDKGQDY